MRPLRSGAERKAAVEVGLVARQKRSEIERFRGPRPTGVFPFALERQPIGASRLTFLRKCGQPPAEGARFFPGNVFHRPRSGRVPWACAVSVGRPSWPLASGATMNVQLAGPDVFRPVGEKVMNSRYRLPTFVPGLLAAIVVCQAAAGERPASVNAQTLDRHVDQALYEIINRGAELYNNGDPAGCCRLFEGALVMAQSILAHRPSLQATIAKGLAKARRRSENGGTGP